MWGPVRLPGLRSGGVRVHNNMVLRDLVGDVLSTLWAHKLRTFLTMFGIAWGIVSIVLMVAAGEGLRQGQEVQARNLGKDILIVFHGRTSMQVGGARAGREVHWEDADVVAVQAVHEVNEFAPFAFLDGLSAVVAEAEVDGSLRVQGIGFRVQGRGRMRERIGLCIS